MSRRIHTYTAPIRDCDGSILFVAVVHSFDELDIYEIPGGGAPFRQAVENAGADPRTHQASIFEAIEVDYVEHFRNEV